MVYTHPMISYISNFKRGRNIPASSVFSTWRNAYQKIGDFRKKLKGNIVCIESADPGYDFIFSENIAGLVTKYGGANSHMSIRCAELGVPAAIGVGKLLFENISSSKLITLNPSSNRIDIIK